MGYTVRKRRLDSRLRCAQHRSMIDISGDQAVLLSFRITDVDGERLLFNIIDFLGGSLCL